MPVTRYRALPTEVEAIQWTGENTTAMTAFAAERFAETAPEDRSPQSSGGRPATPIPPHRAGATP
jgi:hypothetical protein